MDFKISMLPNDIEAERALLGTMLVDSRVVEDALEMLRPHHFYNPEHQIIFEVMQEQNSKSEPIDPITVKNSLELKGMLDKVGGFTYLTQLTETLNILVNPSEYINIILEKHKLRVIIEAGQTMVRRAMSGEEETHAIVDAAEKEIYKIAADREKKSYERLDQILLGTFSEIDELYNNKSDITGLATGFVDFDRKTTGLKGSSLIILAARPGMGKSALAINIATHVATQEKSSVLIFNMEMSKNELAKRILSSESMIENTKISTGNIADEEWDKLAVASSKLSKAELYIDDTPGINIMEIRSKARRLKEKTKGTDKELGLIVIDYLQLIEPVGRRNGTREQEISEISRSLKKLAMELDIPIIALSQLSRSVEKGEKSKRPMLSDLRESGAIEQDADMVLFIYRDDYYNPDSEKANVAEIILAKHRGGSLGTVELLWMGSYTKFENLGDREEEDYGY